MCKRIVLFFVSLSFVFGAFAQESDTIPAGEVPVISYSMPKRYKIADIKVSGLKKEMYEDFTIIGLSGLSVGDMITVPGEEITATVKRFWRHGLFSHVKVLTTKIEDDQIWLEIELRQRPRISQVNYIGIKKGEREELETRLGFRKGYQVTPNLIDRAKMLIQKYFDGKGFKNVDVNVLQKDDLAHEGEVIVDIHIDKNEKTKINEIIFTGNNALTAFQLRKAMKKTNEKFSLPRRFKTSILEIFSTKKFTSEEYDNDKKNLVSKYNEHGYRDAVIVADSVGNFNEKSVNIYLTIEEGHQYFLKDIRFVGNTQYPTDYLAAILQMKPGEVYNQKKLDEHLNTDDESVANVYYNNGYLFFGADPVEVEAENDSISLEIRIQEGPQATINRIIIEGNDRLYEDIIRRELRTKPGMLFSRDDLMRSVRELAQMGHFDPENLVPQPLPDPENGTVDIRFPLVSKANDQVEFSAGWGQVGVIGKLSLKFTNFSMKNFLNPKTYKGIIPQGEGQTLTISGQTNGRYYQGYSISFMDPWFGGKRPNTLSVSAYYSKQSGVNYNFLNNSTSNYWNSGYYSGYPYYGGSSYMGGGYSNYDPYNSYELAYDPNQSLELIAVSTGYGKRLNWPDDYFQFMATLSYQVYMLNNWSNSYGMSAIDFTTGNSHNINLELLLQRSSIDNPLYTRRGSQFTASLSATPPYSLFDGKDYASMSAADKQKLLEYHKWKIKAKVFTPLLPLTVKRTPVLMSRVEYGFLGHYNKNKRSPFETFYMGGDGMTGYTGMTATETIALRGYENGSIAGGNAPYGYAYSRLGMELRYPFLLEPSSTIYGVAFVEAGNAWATLKDFNPFALKRSAGVGVRIFLPMIGLMGIDWAYGFDIPDYSSQRAQRGGSNFHFIIGQEF
ncbi:MAG: outer membrane protein assembly factor BamA [Tannerellaceae bacterium]|jgi:outer membrane protein insertion porin family|nr:outer membrane protein assembly factor BamA [Tannerellaceae bacterium]